jgi:D-alanine-D-alanine ligase
MSKIRVGVLMGGPSIEREVSLNSGRTVCDHLDTLRYEIIPLFQAQDRSIYRLPWNFLHRGKTSDFEHRLPTQAQKISWDALKEYVDFIYIAVHGRHAEDGTLQGFLEILGIPYLGSGVFASAVGMDKIMQKEILASHGIAVAKGIVVTAAESEQYPLHEKKIFAALAEKNISFPLIVKPAYEGSSLGVSVVHHPEQLAAALCKATTVYSFKKQPALVEEKLDGMEFSCITFMDAQGAWFALPPTEVVVDSKVQFFDYEQKYMPGRATEFTPPRTSAENIERIQQECIRAANVLEMETIGRIDGFLCSDGSVAIVDPNTLSGMGPSSFLFREAAHINWSHTRVINHLIETELIRYGKHFIHHETKDQHGMEQEKLRVGILMGGRSNEKEISLESGRNITYKLSPHNYQAVPIFVTDSLELYLLDQKLLVRNSTKEIQELLTPEKKISWNDLAHYCDFVFIGLHGGEGENGCVQGALEMLQLPYNGSSVLASALCMDKFKTTHFLKSKGFDVPLSVLIDAQEWTLQDAPNGAPQDDQERENKSEIVERILKTLSLPLIVKPHDDGCSVMVQKIKEKNQLATALETLFNHGKSHALVEEFIAGMELTVGVIGNENPRALSPSQAVCASEILSIEEKFLPGAGENQTPAPLPAHTLALVQKTMEQAYGAIGCKGYARIDCFYQNAQQSSTGSERVVILEINTLPGMTPATCIFHQAAEVGMRPMDFIDEIIKLGIAEHGVRKESGSKVYYLDSNAQDLLKEKSS